MVNRLSQADRNLIAGLTIPQDASVLTFNERHALRDALRYIYDLENARSWDSPYRKAIAVLEAAERSFTGTFG